MTGWSTPLTQEAVDGDPPKNVVVQAIDAWAWNRRHRQALKHGRHS